MQSQLKTYMIGLAFAFQDFSAQRRHTLPGRPYLPSALIVSQSYSSTSVSRFLPKRTPDTLRACSLARPGMHWRLVPIAYHRLDETALGVKSLSSG